MNATVTNQNQNVQYPPVPRKPGVVLWWMALILSALFGLFFFVAMATDILSGQYVGGSPDYKGDHSLGINITMGIVCGLFPLGLAGLIIYNLFRKKRKYDDELALWLETCILRFSARQNGRITAQETAMELSVSVMKAKEALEQLVTKGMAEVLVSDAGDVIYQIRGIGQDKSKAEGVL
jgi:hypothetical protein